MQREDLKPENHHQKKKRAENLKKSQPLPSPSLFFHITTIFQKLLLSPNHNNHQPAASAGHQNRSSNQHHRIALPCLIIFPKTNPSRTRILVDRAPGNLPHPHTTEELYDYQPITGFILSICLLPHHRNTNRTSEPLRNHHL